VEIGSDPNVLVTPRFGNVKRLAGRDSCFEVLALGWRSAPSAAKNARLSDRLQPLLVLCYPAAEYCHGESSLDAPLLAQKLPGSFDYASRFAFANRLAQFDYITTVAHRSE
jgi:hypothetical protein